MIIVPVRIIFVIVAVFFVWYSAARLGQGMWGIALTLVSIPVVLSMFNPVLDGMARAIVRGTATLAGFALVMTLIAATMGGRFHISPEVWPLVICFVILIVLGVFDRPRESKSDVQE